MVKTRILIISDTHGAVPERVDSSKNGAGDHTASPRSRGEVTGFREPLAKADVVIHCGDLTKLGRSDELDQTFSMLKGLSAPLKLVIAGNHDLCLDPRYPGDGKFKAKAREIIREAEPHGVRYLDEGVHTFDLDNGGRLKVFASQWTPVYGYWAFQYEKNHTFDIPPGVDVAMTHGPPLEVLDLAGTSNLVHAGCGGLFDSVARAKPRIHCYGHIHEAWGAYLAKWTGTAAGAGGSKATAATAIDAQASRMIEELNSLKSLPHDDDESTRLKAQNMKDAIRRRGFLVDLTEGDNRLEAGEKTLFVNAAIMDIRYHPIQAPWLVDMDLPRAS